MKTAAFGASGIQVPIVGQGSWNLETVDENAAIAALRTGLDAGMRHIDTAEMYGSGRVERIVGRAIAGRRDEVFLVSKVLPSNASYRGTIDACHRSLKRLCTDVLDLYLLHWPGSQPLEETIRAFDALQSDGKIRAFGVSNFDVDDLEAAISIAGEGRIACNQVLYHIEERSIEHALIPYCHAHRVSVVAYSPFGSGRFPKRQTQAGGVLAGIAAKRGISPYRVALAFLIRQGGVFAIPKAAKIEHVHDNAAACDLELTAAELAELDTAFPRGRKRRLAMI